MGKNLLHAILLTSLLFLGAGCSLGSGRQATLEPVTLTYWRTEDDPAAFDAVIDAYRKVRPNVTVTIRAIPKADYEQALLEALAENRGPDLFTVPINEFGAWKGKIAPMPSETVIPTLTVDADKRIVVSQQRNQTMGLIRFRNEYVEGASRDLVMPVPDPTTGRDGADGIWGLPFSYDSLALYYNKALLRKAGIEKPPADLRELQEQAAKLTLLGEDGAIRQSGAAVGGSGNVAYSPDILAAFMTQLGAVMADDSGTPRFHTITGTSSGSGPLPGAAALMIYQSFANKGTPNYSWNADMPGSLDAFVSGRTAIYFGYSADLRTIRERAPGLELGIAPLPQQDPSAPKNIARYPVETVSRKSANQQLAWDFLLFAAAPERIGPWLTAVKRPAALRSLLGAQLTDPDIAPFSSQALTARSWYRGGDWPKVERVFHALIDWRPTQRDDDYQRVVSDAARVVSQYR